MFRGGKTACLLIVLPLISGCALLMQRPVMYGGYGGYAYPSPQPNSVATSGYYNEPHGYAYPNSPSQYSNGFESGNQDVQPQNVGPGYTPVSTSANTTATTNSALRYAPATPATSGPSPNTVGQSSPGLKTSGGGIASQTRVLRVPSTSSAGNTSENTGMKKGLAPAAVTSYLLTDHDNKLCVFYRPAEHLGSNNRKRGLLVFNTHTGDVEKCFEAVERLRPTRVYGHYIFVSTLGTSYFYRSNLEVLDTRNWKIREIRLGKGVSLPWSGNNLSSLNWVHWDMLGWGPRHRFVFVDCLNAAPGRRFYDYFTLALEHNGVTVREWAPPWATRVGGQWKLFGGGNSERIDALNVGDDGYDRIFNKRARCVIPLQPGIDDWRLVMAGTGKVLASYSTSDVVARSPNGKKIFAPYKIPGVHSRFLAIMQDPTLKVLKVIPVGHCTTGDAGSSKYFWTPDGRQILIVTQQYHNYSKPRDGWGISFASVADGRVTHFIPLANRIITEFGVNGRYAFILNLGGKAGSYLLCIDLRGDKVVYRTVLPGSFSIGQKARVIPSPGKLVFVAVGHTVFEVNSSSGHVVGKLADMYPYVGRSTFAKDGRRVYLAGFKKAVNGASDLAAVSTFSGRIVRNFALPDVHIEAPSRYQGDGGAFFGY